jgi:hypothetical protein
MTGKMIPIANIVSRSEALVVASMLEGAGIIVRISGEHHASVSMISQALGGYWLTVPDWQQSDARTVLADSFANTPFRFSEAARTAVIKFLLVKFGATVFAVLIGTLGASVTPALVYAFPLLTLLETPVNPQGRSEYYLEALDIDSTE